MLVFRVCSSRCSCRGRLWKGSQSWWHAAFRYQIRSTRSCTQASTPGAARLLMTVVALDQFPSRHPGKRVGRDVPVWPHRLQCRPWAPNPRAPCVFRQTAKANTNRTRPGADTDPQGLIVRGDSSKKETLNSPTRRRHKGRYLPRAQATEIHEVRMLHESPGILQVPHERQI